MAKSKIQIKKSQKAKVDHLHIALTKTNFYIIASGILLIIIGYVFLSQNSVDGFLPTVVAPIFLVLGYCVVIPFGILYKDKSQKTNTEAINNEKESVENISNIKTG